MVQSLPPRDCGASDEAKMSLLNEHGAAERLALSGNTLRRWRILGRGPRFVKLGAAVRYPAESIEQFIAAGAAPVFSKRKGA